MSLSVFPIVPSDQLAYLQVPRDGMAYGEELSPCPQEDGPDSLAKLSPEALPVFHTVQHYLKFSPFSAS